VNRSTTAIGPPHLGQRHSGCAIGAVEVSDSFFGGGAWRAAQHRGSRAARVPAENSIALKSVNSAREGTNSSVSESACRIAECERPRRYRLPERRVTAARYVYILKRKRLLKLLVVHIDGEVLPPVAVQ
jgi:hypothetical protein